MYLKYMQFKHTRKTQICIKTAIETNPKKTPVKKTISTCSHHVLSNTRTFLLTVTVCYLKPTSYSIVSAFPTLVFCEMWWYRAYIIGAPYDDVFGPMSTFPIQYRVL